ncbi:MAG: hypothetical protein J5988_00080 [Eubacterium sp.]|nr:hypothetical protein [Eubacterium sp.]
MALLGTLLETARFGLCANHLERSLVNSTEALLSEYSRPLYEQYGLFFLESGGDSYESVINRYMKESTEPQGKRTTNFLKQQLEEICVTKKEYVGDNHAASLQEEISKMMLRKIGKEQLQSFLAQSQKISGTEQKAQEIEDEVNQQAKEAECNQELLQLMKLIDGIRVTKGKVQCENCFVKMFSLKKPKSLEFGITEPIVWEQMKDQIYVLPDKKERVSALKENVNSVSALIDEAISIRNRLKEKLSGAGNDSSLKTIVESLSVLESNKKVLQLVKEELLKKDCNWDQIGNYFESYDTKSIRFDYTGVSETGGGENPMDALGDAWGKGILNLVMPASEKVSKKSLKTPDKYAKLYEEENKAEDYDKRISDFTKEEKVSLSGILGTAGTYGMDEFCLDRYIQEYFRSFTKKESEWKNCLNYQWEYVIAGKGKDEQNLAAVLNRILLIRTVINFAAIMQSGSMRKEAYAAAAAVVGFTGMEPLIRLVQTLILITWSIVESLVDISGLLQNKQVPMVKSSKEVLTSFPEVFAITKTSITSRAKKLKEATKKSFGYKEYVMLLLAMVPQNVRRYRLMDLIEGDMKQNGHPNFNLASMVFGVHVRAKASIPAYFFRFPTIENMLNRELSAYPEQCSVIVRYV